MGYHHENWVDDTTMEFPRTGFWLVHTVGTAMVFLLGMRFAAKRAPVSMMAYRVMRMLTQR